MADAVCASDRAITHRKKAGLSSAGLSPTFLMMTGHYSPLNFLCHQPLRWGADPAADSASAACSLGPTTTRSMRGSLDPIS
jgi:hypothetical protein